MSLGKGILSLLAGALVLVLTGALIWYVAADVRDRRYEKEGTLVYKEEICPAFVTDPITMVFGASELQKSVKGL